MSKFFHPEALASYKAKSSNPPREVNVLMTELQHTQKALRQTVELFDFHVKDQAALNQAAANELERLNKQYQRLFKIVVVTNVVATLGVVTWAAITLLT